MLEPITSLTSAIQPTTTTPVAASSTTDTTTASGRVNFQMQLAQMLADVLPKSVLGSDEDSEGNSTSGLGSTTSMLPTQIQMLLQNGSTTPSPFAAPAAETSAADSTTDAAGAASSTETGAPTPTSGGLNVF